MGAGAPVPTRHDTTLFLVYILVIMSAVMMPALNGALNKAKEARQLQEEQQEQVLQNQSSEAEDAPAPTP